MGRADPLAKGPGLLFSTFVLFAGAGGCGRKGMRGKGVGEMLQRRWTEVQSGDQLPIGQE